MRLRKWALVGLVAALLGVASIPVLTKAERFLPNSLYALIYGGPAIELDVAGLLASGAGLRNTYRSKWLKASSAQAQRRAGGEVKRLCTATDQRSDCDFRSLAEAFAGLQDGSGLIVSPGNYEEAAVLAANSVAIWAEPGAHIKDRAIRDKAALVITGDDTLIEGLECSGISVSHRNGACIRLEGRNLTLRGVYFHDSEQGVLTGRDFGHLVVEDSLFERLGYGGQAHAVYVGSGPGSVLTVRRTHVLNTKGEGHGIKSRAASTVIEDSVIASLGGTDSRLIDLPSGGVNIIRGNVLQNGPMTSNSDMIGIGLELDSEASDVESNRSSITGNLMILDRQNNRPLHTRNVPAAQFLANAIVGGGRAAAVEGNYWFRNRDMARLAALPGLLE